MNFYIWGLDMNWAGEIDFQSTRVVTKDEKDFLLKAQESLSKDNRSVSFSFGVNEYESYALSEFVTFAHEVSPVPLESVKIAEEAVCSDLFCQWYEIIEQVVNEEYEFEDEFCPICGVELDTLEGETCSTCN